VRVKKISFSSPPLEKFSGGGCECGNRTTTTGGKRLSSFQFQFYFVTYVCHVYVLGTVILPE
jgi:hypothetical protein